VADTPYDERQRTDPVGERGAFNTVEENFWTDCCLETWALAGLTLFVSSHTAKLVQRRMSFIPDKLLSVVRSNMPRKGLANVFLSALRYITHRNRHHISLNFYGRDALDSINFGIIWLYLLHSEVRQDWSNTQSRLSPALNATTCTNAPRTQCNT